MMINLNRLDLANKNRLTVPAGPRQVNLNCLNKKFSD